MKKNITLDSVINKHNRNKHDLIETLSTLVKRQGGVIELNNCEIETKQKMKVHTLEIENDVIFIKYVELNKHLSKHLDKYTYIYSTDDFTYDELYEILVSVCKQLKL